MTAIPRSRSLALLTVSLLASLGLLGCESSGDSGRPTVSGQYAFWPVPPSDPHVQFLQAFNTAADLSQREQGALSRLVFGEDDESLMSAIQKPYGIEMRNGRVYVCDIRKNALVVLDLATEQMRLVGVTGFNSLANPVDVAVSEDGFIYVADNERNAVLVFDQDERFSKVIGHDQFRPVGVAVHGDRLYVCNLDAQLVEVFDRRSGEQAGQIGTVGDEDGQFRVPLGIDTDTEGNVYVVDLMRCRLQKFSPDGEFLAAAGAMGDVAGSFARPKQIAVDRDGIVYVVDAAFNNVQMFDSEFRLLMHFGSAGEYSGAMNLPAGICVSDDGVQYFAGRLHPGFAPKRVVLVTNQFGSMKISAYAMGERRAGWSVADITANAQDVSAGVGQNPATARLQMPGEEEPLGDGEPADQEQPDN